MPLEAEVPKVKMGSSIVTTEELTVVVVPLTVKLLTVVLPNVTLSDVPTGCPIEI